MPPFRLASIALALALSSAAPALADEGLVITLINTSAHEVTGFAVFAVDQTNGHLSDDNLGAISDPIAAKTVDELRLSLFRCQKVHLWASFADGAEVTNQVDLCRDRQIYLINPN